MSRGRLLPTAWTDCEDYSLHTEKAAALCITISPEDIQALYFTNDKTILKRTAILTSDRLGEAQKPI